MKKLLILLTIFASFSLFADNFLPQLHISPSVRQQGFGGFYTTDVDNFYGIYANPAMLGKRKIHSLFPGLNFNPSGPLLDLPDFFVAITDSDVNKLADILKKNSGIKLGMCIEPMMSMGHTTELGFGWGLCTNIFMNASIPNLTRSDIKAGIETVLTAGFAYPVINTDNHILSVGATAKGFYQVSTVFNEGVISISKKVKNLDPGNLPFYMMMGFGFDAGVYYSVCNCIDFAVVYHDPWSPAFITKTTFNEISNIKFDEMKTLEPKLSAGVCWRVHTEATRGTISSFRIMADYQNIFIPFKKVARNPLLEISVGTELVMFNSLSLRFGINELYPAAGVGFALGNFKLDLSIYGKELGMEPGAAPCLNAGLFFGVTY